MRWDNRAGVIKGGTFFFFFFSKDVRGGRNSKGEVEGKSWLFPHSEIW